MTIRDAAQKWVSQSMDGIQTEIIAELMKHAPEKWRELTLYTQDDDVFYETLPIWSTMWSFRERIDDYWLREGDGLKAMSECGFRIYESEDFGIFFGIDGAGYDFYADHWIPLYKARGLHWHEED